LSEKPRESVIDFSLYQETYFNITKTETIIS